jgi:hypothetical protein
MRRLVGALVVIPLLLCLAPAGRAQSRVEQPTLSRIPSFPFSDPYEDVRLKP